MFDDSKPPPPPPDSEGAEIGDIGAAFMIGGTDGDPKPDWIELLPLSSPKFCNEFMSGVHDVFEITGLDPASPL